MRFVPLIVGAQGWPDDMADRKPGSIEAGEQAREQPATLRQTLHHDMFLQSMERIASGAEAVQGQDAERAGEGMPSEPPP